MGKKDANLGRAMIKARHTRKSGGRKDGWVNI